MITLELDGNEGVWVGVVPHKAGVSSNTVDSGPAAVDRETGAHAGWSNLMSYDQLRFGYQTED